MKASLKLLRDHYTKKSTQGKLYLNGVYVCETLEDTCRDLNHDGDLNDEGEKKVYGETCIPSGTYKLILYMSPHFKQKLFWLQKVKDYEYVLIHCGNYVTDTLGCVLVGMTRSPDTIGDSKTALKKLMDLTVGKFTEYELEIVDAINLN